MPANPLSHSFFAQRVAVLATMHHKEKVIAPVLEHELGLRVVVPTGLDTDVFGTFTRDRDRPGNQLEAARLKAEAALALTGGDLAIASEGTFAPHPNFPAVPCNQELVLLLDRANDLELVGYELSPETNYNHQTIKTYSEALAFAARVGFPAHGIVVMVSQTAKQPEDIFKGITDERQLLEAVTTALARSSTGTIHIETDMRALYNPTRLMVIQKATFDLAHRAKQRCPACHTPGFSLTERLPGLPCDICCLPTSLSLTAIYRCHKCQFTQTIPFPDGIETADPAQCNFCNP